jgi:hypothetical protein
MKFIPCIQVNSIEEYFALPKKERTWYGLYMSPRSLPFVWEDGGGFGWDKFYQELKKEFPVQYFFRYWLTSFDNPITHSIYQYLIWPYQNFKNAWRNFWNPCCPRWRKVLPKTQYSDVSNLIVDSNLALLRDFYYEEVLISKIDWDSTEELKTFRNDIEKHIYWLDEESKKNDEEISNLIQEAYTGGKTPKSKFQTLTKKIHDLENKKEKNIDKILKWMITNREHFWT